MRERIAELFEIAKINLSDIMNRLSKEAMLMICDEDDVPLSTGKQSRIIKSKLYLVIRDCEVIGFEILTTVSVGLVFKILINVDDVFRDIIDSI